MLTVLSVQVDAAAEGTGGFWETAYPIIPHPGELVVGPSALPSCCGSTPPGWSRRWKIHAQRVAAIEGGMAEAEKEKEEARALLAQYRRSLPARKTRPTRFASKPARTQPRSPSRCTTRRSPRQSASLRAPTARSRPTQQAIISLHHDVGHLAADLQPIVGESLHDSARQSGVIDRFIADLEQADAEAIRSAATVQDGVN